MNYSSLEVRGSMSRKGHGEGSEKLKLDKLFNGILAKIDTLNGHMNKQFEKVEKRIGTRIDGVEKRIGTRIDGVEKRIDGVEKHIDRVQKQIGKRIDGVEKRIDGVEKRIDRVQKQIGTRIDGVEKQIGKRIDGVIKNLSDIQEIVNNKLPDDDSFVLKVKAYFRALICAKLQDREETRGENEESETYKYQVLCIDAPCPMIRARGQINAYSRAPEKRDAAGSAFHTSGAIVSSEHTGGSVKKLSMREIDIENKKREQQMTNTAFRKKGSPATMLITESETDGIRAQKKTDADASATASSQVVLVPASTSAGKSGSKSKISLPRKVQCPTKIIIRPCYRLLYDMLMDAAYTNEDLGKRFNRFIVSGAPGIGKSTAFGAGYLMYRMFRDIREGMLTKIQHVLWTSSKGVSVVFHIDKTVIHGVYGGTNQELNVDVYTSYTGAVPKLACAETTFWIMDNREHGPFDSAEGVVLLIPSCKRENYQEMRKTNCKIWYLPVWDGGPHRRNGFSLEMKALCTNCYVGPDDVLKRVLQEVEIIYNAVGPFPREAANKSLAQAVNCRNEDLSMIKVKDWSLHFLEGTVHFGVDTPSNRLFYPEVDRKSLQITGRSIPASKYIEYEMIRASARHDFQRTLKKIVIRADLSGHVHWNHGKDFELAMVLYLDTCGRKIQYRKLHSGYEHGTARTYEELELPSYGEDENLVPQLQFVNAFTTTPARTGCFFHSRTTNEPVVDAYFISRVCRRPDGVNQITVYLLQITLNPKHKIKMPALTRLKNYILKGLQSEHKKAEIKFMYIFLTTEKRSNEFNIVGHAKIEQYVAYVNDFPNKTFDGPDKRKEASGHERKGKRPRPAEDSSGDDDGIPEDISEGTDAFSSFADDSDD